MKIRAMVHPAEEGGYWAEVPALPGCITEEDTNALPLDGMKKSEAAQVLQVSRNAIDLWLKRQAEVGDYAAKSTRPHCTTAKIRDWGQFTTFAQAHGDKTQAEMAARWDSTVSARTIARALQKIDWSRKKRRTASRNLLCPKAPGDRDSVAHYRLVLSFNDRPFGYVHLQA